MQNQYRTKLSDGVLSIFNHTGSVSWKSDVNCGAQAIHAYKDGFHGAGISVTEAFLADNNKTFRRQTVIHLEAQQLDELIAHLQSIRADIAERQAA